MRAARGPVQPTPPASLPLTGREAQVAGLASVRWSDREIAAALFISVRTVESHLSSVYRNLGVGSRRELPRGGTPGTLAVTTPHLVQPAGARPPSIIPGPATARSAAVAARLTVPEQLGE